MPETLLSLFCLSLSQRDPGCVGWTGDGAHGWLTHGPGEGRTEGTEKLDFNLHEGGLGEEQLGHKA